MRILHVSDCHLPGDPAQGYRRADAHKNLQDILQKGRAFSPDLLLATGDLSEDASQASYLALQRYFKCIDAPVLALPGNHDDAGLLATTFPGSPVDDLAVSEYGGWQIICLNSCLPGRPDGRLSCATLARLEQVLRVATGQPRIIALHHQPIAIGSQWIDRYPLREPEAFLKLIDCCADVKAVVWGHVHQAFSTNRHGTTLLAGPSSVINSLPGAQAFTPDPSGPACRWLELQQGGAVCSGVL